MKTSNSNTLNSFKKKSSATYLAAYPSIPILITGGGLLLSPLMQAQLVGQEDQTDGGGTGGNTDAATDGCACSTDAKTYDSTEVNNQAMEAKAVDNGAATFGNQSMAIGQNADPGSATTHTNPTTVGYGAKAENAFATASGSTASV